MKEYLSISEFYDYNHSAVAELTQRLVHGIDEPREQAKALYKWVRDEIRYNPYTYSRKSESFKASNCLEQGEGYCIPKAILLGAMARMCGIPARLGLADVRNHLSSPQFLELLKTDVFVMHGYVELYLDGAWYKATPAFDAKLCEKMGVDVLEFDGVSDSVFQPFDTAGRKHMEYLAEYGTFEDVPLAFIEAQVTNAYPHLAGIEFSTLRGRSLTNDINRLDQSHQS